MEFRWIEWNVDKCLKHEIDPADAEYVVRHARAYPRKIGDEKTLVGKAESGQYLQVVYLVDMDDAIFVIHAMPLTERDKRRFRRRRP